MARCSALALLLVLGCSARAAERSPCELSPAHEIASAETARFDGVSLDAAGERVLAAWSDASGLYVRALDGQGAALHPAVRLGEPCRGGVDVEVGPGHAYVGCVRPGDDDTSDVVLYTLDAQLRASPVSLGRAGRDGRGIDVESDAGRVSAAYLDGATGVHALRLATLADGKLTERTLTRVGRAGSEPALLVAQGTRHALFTETDFDEPGVATTRIMLARDDEPARALRSVRVPDPSPRLVRDAAGLVLTFRDRPPKERKAELYAVRLRADLTLAGEPRKVGRANSEGAPSLHTCQGQRLALTPREYGGERYVAVHRLDSALENLSGSHQFYANSRDFVLAAGACVGDALLFVAAEQRTPAERGVAIEAMRFRCR